MSQPKFYRLDLVNLGELFDPDVAFEEWYKKCQSAGAAGFGNNRLADHAPNLTPLEHTERICGMSPEQHSAVWSQLTHLAARLVQVTVHQPKRGWTCMAQHCSHLPLVDSYGSQGDRTWNAQKASKNKARRQKC